MQLVGNWQIKVKLFLVCNHIKKTKEKHFCSSLVLFGLLKIEKVYEVLFFLKGYCIFDLKAQVCVFQAWQKFSKRGFIFSKKHYKTQTERFAFYKTKK
jgi:hypothetical protein